ncbi:MAG: helix-turn-helix domain-containing protein [Cyclobacteriaceae bacterium]
MKTQLTNIKDWLQEVIFDAIENAFIKYYPRKDPDTNFLNAQESAAYLGDAMPTFYRRVSEGELPTYGGGKKIFCKESDLMDWLSQSRSYSKEQLEKNAIENMQYRAVRRTS